MPIIQSSKTKHFSYSELSIKEQCNNYNRFLEFFYHYFNSVTDINEKEDFFNKHIIINQGLIDELLVRVDKRKDYYVIYHDYDFISELKEASLLAYWVLKHKPFSLKLPKNKYNSLRTRDFNVGFALYLVLSSIQCSVWKEKNDIFLLENSTVQLMSYAFKNWDLSKEAIILLVETLADLKIKEKDYKCNTSGLESFYKNDD